MTRSSNRPRRRSDETQPASDVYRVTGGRVRTDRLAENARVRVANTVTVSAGSRRSSCTGTVDLDDVFGHVDELVHQTLAVHFGEDASLVVIPEEKKKPAVNMRSQQKKKIQA